MFRTLGIVLALLVLPSVAIAQPGLVPEEVVAPEPESEPVGTQDVIAPEPDPVDSQEIGVLVGAAIGGGVSPGGVSVDGRYLYRLSELDWFEIGANFALGGGSAECFRDRESELVCEHGLLDGFGAEASAGLRRYFTGQQQFRPYARAGIGLRLLSFSGDNLRGVAIPLSAGGGIRVDVANRVLVVAEASLRAGPAFMGRGLGLQANLGLSVGAGVEFTLE